MGDRYEMTTLGVHKCMALRDGKCEVRSFAVGSNTGRAKAGRIEQVGCTGTKRAEGHWGDQST